MSFLSPLFLIGAAAAVVPIVLHLLKRHTKDRVRFAAVALLKGAPVEHSVQRRLRQWLLLAFRVAALLLLAFAFARPFFGALSTSGGRLTVVAIDGSLSMSAPAQLAEARKRAHDAIRAAGGDVAVVVFSDRASIAVPPTSSRSAADSAIDALAPGFGSTNYRAAFGAAGELFRGRSGALIVVTDLQANGWDAGGRAAVPQGARIEVQDVGAIAENVAVTDLRVEGDRVVATLANTGASETVARVTLTVDGKAIRTTAMHVRGHDIADAAFEGVPSTGIARVDVDDPRGIPGDNSRYVFLGGASSASVLVVTASGDLDKDAWYVRQALVAGAAGRSGDVTGVAAAQLGAWSGDQISRFATVVVLSSRGLERRARERLASYVSNGGGLMIAAGPDVDGDVISDVLGGGGPLEMKPIAAQPLSLAPADVRHPIFRAFGGDVASLTVVRFQNVSHVSGPGCETVARFTSGDAAVLDCGAGSGRAVIVASDLNNRWNDFPVRASFVPFIEETVRYLSSNRTRVAEYLVADVPRGVAAAPGVSVIDGANPRRVIVNVDPAESQLDRMSVGDFETAITHLKDSAANEARAELTEQENRQHTWQYLMGAVVLLLLAEGIVAARAA
jgi:hypothetical protein